jgi:YVTN family beta-propeller protein
MRSGSRTFAKKLIGVTFLAVLASASSTRGGQQEQLRVGLQANGRIVVPTNQILEPAGKQITFPGRPVDLALAEGGRLLVVKNMKSLVFIDAASGMIRQTLALPKSKEAHEDDKDLGFSVVGLLVDGDHIFVSDSQEHVRIAVRQADGRYRWAETAIKVARPAVGGFADPAGIARSSQGTLWIATTRGNCIQPIDRNTLQAGPPVAAGVAPYMICCLNGDRCYVSNWGGDPPRPGTPQRKSSDSPVQVDPRTQVANHGSVSVISRTGSLWRQTKSIEVGLHPSGLLLSPRGQFLYVANANSDTVSVIDTRTDRVVESIACRPEGRLPFGSGSNALALSPDGKTLYVANGTNNCLAVIRLGKASSETAATDLRSRLQGMIPTGWYPGAVLVSADGKQLYVANVKGHGALGPGKPGAKGKNSHYHLGSVSIIDVPDDAQLARHTAKVNANNRLGYSLAGLERPRPDAKPVPIPLRHGEPSVFKHVLYIIKENRTYDQVFGDMPEGNGDPNLVMFGEAVTPNHHALAREFTLLDNFYCSGVLSADGHSWTDSAYVTDYLEKAFGGFTRSYPDDGRDPLAFSLTGFLWDNALAHGRTLRNYGEFVLEQDYAPKGTTWTDLYRDYRTGAFKIQLSPKASTPTLKPYTHPTYPYFPLVASDQYRAELFLRDFRQFEKKGQLPHLLYMSLPCDHTEGTRPGFPTPRAMVADNDLALGRIVEAVSNSRFWKDTCIFVVEDDPQDGFDHMDGHRTVALAISPYTRRDHVDHTNYNQTGMVKSIELVLGLPPMNQMDLSATPMRSCFQMTPDFTPYICRPNQVVLDELNPPLKQLAGKPLFWAQKSLALDLDRADRADEDTFNRILWHATRGYDTPYPEQHTSRGDDDDE